ncbi:MAG: SDR family NAD(P)-dependent oxidoreductase, partial [Oscillochloris sp.]|nr:SDR family NAD(P)-dependent oxidoreductase [Oscillochloris sp.]
SFAISADVTSAASCEALLTKVLDTCGHIDVLVNNAGIATGGPISELDEAELRTLVAVNVYGPIQLSRLVVPEMLKRGSGHIVNISSTAGLLSPPGQTAYAASRAAILGFSDALRRELEGSGVYVSVIMPGWTKTGMLADMEPDKMRAAGMIGPGLGLDLPEIPAQAVVDAVRYRRREIILGGPLALLGWTATRGLIGVTDAYYRYLIDIHKMVEVMRDMGT